MRWLVIEMKSRLQHVRAVVEQLQSGVQKVEHDPRFRAGPAGSAETMVAAIVCSGPLHAADLDVAQRERVRFRGRNLPVKLKRCGVALTDLLD